MRMDVDRLYGRRDEFHTTTAHAPHELALPDFFDITAAARSGIGGKRSTSLKWNRDPEEFDFRLLRSGRRKSSVRDISIPDRRTRLSERELVFAQREVSRNLQRHLLQRSNNFTMDRKTDEFEFNWRQPFPY